MVNPRKGCKMLKSIVFLGGGIRLKGGFAEKNSCTIYVL